MKRLILLLSLSVTLNVSATDYKGTPYYEGMPLAVSGVVEAEDFDNGGEWTKYTIDVKEDGKCSIETFCVSGSGNGRFRFEVEGVGVCRGLEDFHEAARVHKYNGKYYFHIPTTIITKKETMCAMPLR